MASGKINRRPDQEAQQPQNQRAGEIDICDHKAKGEPGSGEGFYGKNRRNRFHGGLDEFVEAVEDLTEYRFIVGGLQPQNHSNDDGELNEGKSEEGRVSEPKSA